jgi:hypothetical protein
MSTMIGKVIFSYKSMTVEALMEDDGTWRCDAIPCLVRPLNLLYSPTVFGESLEERRSLHCLGSAARWLRGEVRAGRNAGSTAPRNDRKSMW